MHIGIYNRIQQRDEEEHFLEIREIFPYQN